MKGGESFINKLLYIVIGFIVIAVIYRTIILVRNVIKKTAFGLLLYKAKPVITAEVTSLCILIASSTLMLWQLVHRHHSYLTLAAEFPNLLSIDLAWEMSAYRTNMILLLGIFVLSLTREIYILLVGFKIYEEGILTSKGFWYWDELDHFNITEDEQELLYIFTKARWFKKKYFFLKEACKGETYSLLAEKLERRKMKE